MKVFRIFVFRVVDFADTYLVLITRRTRLGKKFSIETYIIKLVFIRLLDKSIIGIFVIKKKINFRIYLKKKRMKLF